MLKLRITLIGLPFLNLKCHMLFCFWLSPLSPMLSNCWKVKFVLHPLAVYRVHHCADFYHCLINLVCLLLWSHDICCVFTMPNPNLLGLRTVLISKFFLVPVGKCVDNTMILYAGELRQFTTGRMGWSVFCIFIRPLAIVTTRQK